MEHYNVNYLAKLFLMRIGSAYERSGLALLRETIPPEEAELIRRALEQRVEEAQSNCQWIAEMTDDEEGSASRLSGDSFAVSKDVNNFIAEYMLLSPPQPAVPDVDSTEIPPLDDHYASSMGSMTPDPPSSLPPPSLSSLPSLLDMPATASEGRTSPSELSSTPARRNPPGRKSQQMAELEGLVLQLRDRSDPRGEAWKCTICSHITTRKHDILRHTVSHPGIKSPINCRGCGESFRRTEARQKHWIQYPDCRKRDEQESKQLNDWTIRHGRRKRQDLF